MTKDDTTLSEDWYDFTQNSSMHGVGYVHLRDYSIVRRVAWLGFILGTLAYFSYAAYLFMDVYANKGVNTKIRMKTASELELPTITVCNRNLWKISAIDRAAKRFGEEELHHIMEALYNEDIKLPPENDAYNWTADGYAEINALTANETEVLLATAAHPFTELVNSCKLHGKKINCSEIFVTVKTDGGYCVQFNSNGSIKQTAAGKTRGLTFTTYINVGEYTTGPFSTSDGILFNLHESHDVPLVEELSTGIIPGVEADIMVTKSTTVRKPPPADNNRANCFDTSTKPNPLHYYDIYTYSACQVECKTEYVINKCGCRDPFQPPLNGSTQCLFREMLYCSMPALRNYIADPEGLRSCDCKDACNVTEYTSKISTTAFPSTKYVSLYQLDQATLDFFKANIALVNIYYGKMSYQRLDEEFAYGITDMIANLGGTLGLCVGASILTICEFCEFGARAVGKCVTSRGKKNAVSSTQIKVAPQNITY